MKVGDYVIINSYGLSLNLIERVTDARVYFTPNGFRQRYVSRAKGTVVFTGSRDVCERLMEQLTSARARRNEEERQANLRYQKRWEELVAVASMVNQ